MSVIIRLQNLPWSANALDIRNFFRGLSIPEGGVHIVGGELGDAFIAFSTDEDARQAMMLDGGKIKEIQVKLLLSSRSEMHKVIEAARQSVPILSLTAPAAPTPAPAPAPAPAAIQPPVVAPPQPAPPVVPAITPFSAALGNNPLGNFGIPGIGNPQEIPQPAIIEPPVPLLSPTQTNTEDEKDEVEGKRNREKDRRRSRTRSRSRDRDRKDRKRDRRDRSRSRDRRRRDRSRSRDRRDRKRDRKDRSRSRDRSPSRRSRDRRERKSPMTSQERTFDNQNVDLPNVPPAPSISNTMNPSMPSPLMNPIVPNGQNDSSQNMFDPSIAEAFNKLQELGKKRNPNAFQGDQPNNNRFQGGRGGGAPRGGGSYRRERPSRFGDGEPQRDCCVAIRNAPNHTSYGDVRRFFPFMIDKHGIKMINDNLGRRTGNIFVRFCDPRSKQLALQRKSNELKGAQVIVEALDDESYDSAVDSFLPYREENDDDDSTLIISDNKEETQQPFTVLKLTDLPNFVKEHDIIKAFSDFSLLSITLVDCRVTRSKIAFVQFVKQEDAKVAFDRKERYMFGRRQPTLTPLSNDDYENEKAALMDKPVEQPRMMPKEPEPVPEPVVPRDPRQRRQQFEDKSQKIAPPVQEGPQGAAQFFAPPFVQQNFGAPFPGPQFGAFPAPANMDPRAANWARPAFPNQMNQMPAMPLITPNAISSEVIDDEPLDCVLMKGLPRDATDRTIVTFLSDTGAVPARIHLMLDGNGLPSGDCFCEFRSPHEARMAATKHGENLEGCRITVDLVTRSVVEEALEGPKQAEVAARESLLGNGPSMPPTFFENQRGGYMGRPYRGRGGFDSNRGYERGSYRGSFDQSRGGYRGRGGYDRGRGGYERGRGRGYRGRGGYENGREREMRNDDEQDPALEDFGAPGCVVSMENVPFRATIDDILGFFSEFELTQDDVIRRYNERGQPTGDARVAFRTPFDAQRAVKTRHMDMILDRRISLAVL